MRDLLAVLRTAQASAAPLTPRALLAFEAAEVRALYDAGVIVNETDKYGRAVVRVLHLPSGDGSGARGFDVDAYLREAYPTGTSFKEMAARTGLKGGDVLMRAHALKLTRGERFTGREIPAWRVARLRGQLKAAAARGRNPADDGEDLLHPALRRRYAAARAGRWAAAARFIPIVCIDVDADGLVPGRHVLSPVAATRTDLLRWPNVVVSGLADGGRAFLGIAGLLDLECGRRGGNGLLMASAVVLAEPRLFTNPLPDRGKQGPRSQSQYYGGLLAERYVRTWIHLAGVLPAAPAQVAA